MILDFGMRILDFALMFTRNPTPETLKAG